jgi:hypothetical protein
MSHFSVLKFEHLNFTSWLGLNLHPFNCTFSQSYLGSALASFILPLYTLLSNASFLLYPFALLSSSTLSLSLSFGLLLFLFKLHEILLIPKGQVCLKASDVFQSTRPLLLLPM